jgi:hypothetical protein
MVKEHLNISILKRFNPEDPETLAEVLSEDFVWHYINPKLPKLEGDYSGLSGLRSFFQELAGRTGGSFKVNPISIVPLGDQLVITYVRDSMLFDGKQMEIEAVVLWCFIDGKIKEAWDIPVIPTATVMKS